MQQKEALGRGRVDCAGQFAHYAKCTVEGTVVGSGLEAAHSRLQVMHPGTVLVGAGPGSNLWL